jgi:hypothetical protein
MEDDQDIAEDLKSAQIYFNHEALDILLFSICNENLSCSNLVSVCVCVSECKFIELLLLFHPNKKEATKHRSCRVSRNMHMSHTSSGPLLTFFI